MNLFESDRTEDGQSKSAKLAADILSKTEKVENSTTREVTNASVEDKVFRPEKKVTITEGKMEVTENKVTESRFSLEKFDKINKISEKIVDAEVNENKEIEDFKVCIPFFLGANVI